MPEKLRLRFAQAYALLRGAMLLAFTVAFLAAPEKLLPGSSSEPAWSLALMFTSRTALLASTLIGLTWRGKRTGLAWVLFADAALQVFDTGLALAMGKGATAVMPLLLGVLDTLAGRTLLPKTANKSAGH